MKRAKSVICAIIMMFAISACAGRTPNDSAVSTSGQEEISKETEEKALTASTENGSDGIPEQEGSKEEVVVMDELILSVGDKRLSVEWEDNESVDALKDLAGSGMKIDMAMYGGFEQVGSIGTSLPRNDSQTTTSPGDIVLYSGNQIVIFYGSNSWAYTRLGRITGLDEKELEDTFGNGDVTIGLSVGAKTASDAARSFDFEDRSVMLNSGYKMPIMGLEKLDIGYIDMMLLHHPGKGDVEAYKTMEKYVEKGKIRSIGLSNGYVEELTEYHLHSSFCGGICKEVSW